jgi:hypothetical protein
MRDRLRRHFGLGLLIYLNDIGHASPRRAAIATLRSS